MAPREAAWLPAASGAFAWRPMRRSLCSDKASKPPEAGSMRTMHAPGDGGAAGSMDGGGFGAVSSADDISTLKLYRDCLKLSYHIAAASAKGIAMRSMIRQNFRQNMAVEDPKEVRRLKMLAVVALQNYVIYEQTGKALEKRGKK